MRAYRKNLLEGSYEVPAATILAFKFHPISEACVLSSSRETVVLGLSMEKVMGRGATSMVQIFDPLEEEKSMRPGKSRTVERENWTGVGLGLGFRGSCF